MLTRQRVQTFLRPSGGSRLRNVTPDTGGTAEAFQELSEAYAVLSDPERKKRYDDLQSGKFVDQDSINLEELCKLACNLVD